MPASCSLFRYLEHWAKRASFSSSGREAVIPQGMMTIWERRQVLTIFAIYFLCMNKCASASLLQIPSQNEKMAFFCAHNKNSLPASMSGTSPCLGVTLPAGRRPWVAGQVPCCLHAPWWGHRWFWLWFPKSSGKPAASRQASWDPQTWSQTSWRSSGQDGGR